MKSIMRHSSNRDTIKVFLGEEMLKTEEQVGLTAPLLLPVLGAAVILVSRNWEHLERSDYNQEVEFHHHRNHPGPGLHQSLFEVRWVTDVMDDSRPRM